MANADGQIILGLNINATSANIQAGLNSILNSTKTKQIVLKTAIEKAQTEKSIESLVSSLSKKTVKLGVEINTKDVQSILAQQQKIASTQANLTRQMQEYRKVAKDTGITLNKNTWNDFNHAIKTEDFVKAREIIKSAKQQIDQYNSSLKKMNSDTSVSGSVTSIVEKFRQLNTVSGETKQKITQLKAALTRFENADSEQKKLRAYEALKQRLAELSNEYKKLSSVERSTIGNAPKTLEGIANRSLELKLAVDSSGINGSGITELSSRLDELRIKAEGLQQRIANLDPSNASDVKQLQAEILNLDREFKRVEKDAKIFEDVNSIATFTANIEKAKQKVEEYAQKYSAIKSRPDLVQELERLKTAANNISTPSQLKQWNAEFATFDTKVMQAGVHCRSFGDILKSAFSNFAQFFSASRIIYEVIASIKKMVSAVKELDSAMVELRKVTDAPESDFQAFFERSKKSAIDYATTMKDIINSTADFSRLGFTFKESEELSKTASVYNTVGDIDNIGKATESIISTMKAFGVETENTMSIVDKFNEVGNNFAISSEGIGDAFTRSASSMAAANNTIDQTVALITAANTVVQDPDSVGTAFKTISMRIRGATTELEQAGLETDGMVESTAKLREEIMALSGVDIMLDKNTFKSTYQILDELSEKWTELTDIQQASITELIAGKRQGNIVSSIMKNFDVARDALETSLGSSGSAMKEFEIQLDSIESKSKQFQAAFEALSTSVINSNLLKGLIDTGTTLLTVIDSLIEKLGGFGNTLTIIGLAIAALNFKGTVSLFTSIFNSLKTGFGIVPKVVKVFGDLKAAWEIGQSAGGGFITTLKGASTALIGTASAASIATAAIMAVVAVIAIAVMAHQNYKRSIEEARQKTLEESNAVIDNTNKLKSAYVTYMQYANKSSLTSGEEEEFKSAIDQVTESLGYKAKAMQGATAGTEEYTKAMQGAIQADLKEAQIKAQQATKAAKDNLIDKSYSDWNGSKIDFEINRQFHDMDDDLRNYLDNLDWVKRSAQSVGQGVAISTFKFSPTDSKDAQSVVDYYYQLIDLQNKLTEDGKIETQLYEDANRVTGILSDTVEDYLKKKYEELSLTYQLNNGIPTTIEEFKKYRDYLNSEMGSNFTFDDNNDKLSNIIDGYLTEVEQYSDFIRELDNVESDTSALDEKINSYNDLTKQILECNDAQEKNKLIAEQNALGKEIEDIAKLTSQYDGLTTAYENWQKAQSSENEGTKYDTIADELKNIKELYDKGLVGTDDFKTAVQLMSNQNLTNDSSIEQFVGAFEKSYPQMQKYFTDGREGCQRFLNDISNINSEWAHMNQDGSWEINFNDKEVSEELELSIGAVQAIMKKLKDYGFNIDLSPSLESLANLKGAIETANDKLKELNKTEIDFDVNSTNVDDLINQIDSASQIFDTFKKEDGTIDLSVEGAQEAKTILAALIMQKQQVSEPAIIEFNFNAETAKSEIESAALLINDFRTKYRELEVKIATGEDTSELQKEIQGIVTQIDQVPNEVKTSLGLDTDEFNTAVDTLTSKTVDVKAGVTLDADALAAFNANLLGITPSLLVKAGLDDTLIKNYNPDDAYEKIGTVKYKVDDTLVKQYNPKDLHRTVYYKVQEEGAAKAQGQWGATESGIALGGELGQELVVRNGKFFTIGDDGAEFFNYKKDDIIFNAEQTKQILEKGKISSGNRRGRALVEGTAFDGGNTWLGGGRFYSAGKPITSKYTSSGSSKTANSSDSSTSSKSSSKKSDEETEFERQYKYHQHLLAMDQESTQAYLDWLVNAYKEAYSAGQIELDDFYKYEEEVYDKSKTIFSDLIKDSEHAIEMWGNQGGHSQDIINEYRAMQEAVHDQAEYYRSLGLSEDNDLIQDLQKQWWDYSKKITDTIKDTYDEIVRSIEDSIDLSEEHLKEFVNVYDDGSTENFSKSIAEKYFNIQNNLHDEAEILRALGYSEDSKEIQDLQKQWWDAEHNKNSSLKDIFDRRLELSEDYIERSKVLGWENGDNEIKARERILKWVSSDYYRSLCEDEEEWQEEYLEQLKNYNSTVISTIDKIYDNYSDAINKVNDEIDEQISKEQGLLDIKNKQYEAINKLSEAQHNADKAIATSRISKAYLSPAEYERIYNEEDYRAISNIIDDIDYDISRLTSNFNKQIENAYANGQEYLIENITAEYERQVELKMQELNIAQAELEVTKKQTELNNILQERNIRQIVEKNGKLQWEWVADADKVREATEALSDAEYEQQKAINEKNQQINLNRMQENIDDFTDEQKRNNKLVEQLGDTIDDIKKTIDDIENPIEGLTIDVKNLKEKGVVNFSKAIDSMVEKLGNIAINSSSTAKSTVSKSSGGVSYGSGGGSSKVTYDKDVDYMAQAQSAIKSGDYASAQKAIDKRNAKIDGEGLSYAKQSLSDVKKSMGYAGGTTNATKGLHEIEENGDETYITSDGKFHNFSGGEIVFDNDKTKALYNLASKLTTLSNGSSQTPLPISKSSLANTLSIMQGQNGDSQNNNYSFGDIIVNNPSDYNAFTRELIKTIKEKTV